MDKPTDAQRLELLLERHRKLAVLRKTKINQKAGITKQLVDAKKLATLRLRNMQEAGARQRPDLNTKPNPLNSAQAKQRVYQQRRAEQAARNKQRVKLRKEGEGTGNG